MMHTARKMIQQYLRYALACRLHHHAASLAYSSLLAIIPISTIIVWSLYKTHLSQNVVLETEQWILTQITGNTNQHLIDMLSSFIHDAYHHISWLTIGSLLISLMLLISNTESSFNAIWQTNQQAPRALKLLQHTAIFLLLPTILALTFMGKTSLTLLWPSLHIERIWPVLSWALRWSLLWALYWYLPRTCVHGKSALVGSLWASLLLMITHAGLAIYFHFFSTLQSFYGHLWMIPTFLLWLYLAWIMILIGAVITYLHQNQPSTL